MKSEHYNTKLFSFIPLIRDVQALALLCLLLAVGPKAAAVEAEPDSGPTWSVAFTGGGFMVVDMDATEDGGAALTGYYDNGDLGKDAVVLRLDAWGGKLWKWTLGGKGDDLGLAISGTEDGGFVVAVKTGSFGGSYPWIVKLDQKGDKEWDRIIPGEGSTTISDIIQTPDGGFMVTGFYFSQLGDSGPMAARLDPEGELEWIQNYDGYEARKVIAAPGGGYVVGGIKKLGDPSVPYVWVLKIDDDGEVVWNKHYGHGGHDELFDIAATADGGYIIGGGARMQGASAGEALVIRLDKKGKVLWEEILGGIQTDLAYGVIEAGDHGFLMAGRTSSFGAGLSDGWLIKLADDGQVVWEKTFGGDKKDAFAVIRPAAGGEALIAGIRDSWQLTSGGDVWVLRLDRDGEFETTIEPLALFGASEPINDPTQPHVSFQQPEPDQPVFIEPEPESNQPVFVKPEPESDEPAIELASEPEPDQPVFIEPEPEPAVDVCPKPPPVVCPLTKEEIYCSLAGKFTIERYEGWEFKYTATDIFTVLEPKTRSSLLARFIEMPNLWENKNDLENWLILDLKAHFPDATVLRTGEVDVRGRTGYLVDIDLTEAGAERFEGARYRTIVFPVDGRLLQFAALWDSRVKDVEKAVDCMFISIYGWD